MQNLASYPSSSSLKRSISTPGTLFSLKSFGTLENDSFDYDRNKLPPNGKYGSVAKSPFRLLKDVSPEELAKQLTLIDWSIFIRISRSELKPGQWTGSMKHALSPNVVAFTRRFNILTFWISDEILSVKLPKQRADVISYYIKVTNQLIELKSLYSSYAIYCAFTSEPIHRLDKTWACLSKKDRQNFEKIQDLFSQADNSIKLRNFMDAALNAVNPVCIPNLSTFLRDIIHIDSAYPQGDTARAGERARKFESIYSYIEKCQHSNYDNIELVEYIYDYLNSFNYIEELQKFREDDYYKISLKLEPNETEVNKNKSKLYHGNRFTSQYDISSTFYINDVDSSTNFNVKQARSMLNKSLNEDLFFQTKYQQIVTKTEQANSSNNFKPGHRKTNSLEAGPNCLLPPNMKTNSLNKQSHQQRNNVNKLNLIDDSPSVDLFALSYKCDRKPTLEVKLRKSTTNYNIDSSSYSNEEDASSLDDFNHTTTSENSRTTMRNALKLTYSYNDLLHSGLVSRKNVLKVGKKPSFAIWFNYYLALSNDSLLFFSSKSNCQSKSFCSKPIKSLPLCDWSVYFEDSTQYNEKKNVFTLADHSCTTVYRIRTATESEARQWVQMIHKSTNNLKDLAYML